MLNSFKRKGLCWHTLFLDLYYSGDCNDLCFSFPNEEDIFEDGNVIVVSYSNPM